MFNVHDCIMQHNMHNPTVKYLHQACTPVHEISLFIFHAHLLYPYMNLRVSLLQNRLTGAHNYMSKVCVKLCACEKIFDVMMESEGGGSCYE